MYYSSVRSSRGLRLRTSLFDVVTAAGTLPRFVGAFVRLEKPAPHTCLGEPQWVDIQDGYPL